MSKNIKSVLIVDDEATDLMLIERSIVKAAPDFEVTTSRGGADAVAKIGSGGADIVLLDINMPGLNGFEVLREARASGAGDVPPVIMFSTSDRDEDIRRAYAEGAAAYVVKPGNLDGYADLAQSMQSFWAGHAVRPATGG